MMTFETDRLLTVLILGLAALLWWSSPLFSDGQWRRWWRVALCAAFATMLTTVSFSFWKFERGLERTYYAASYFSGKPVKNTVLKDRKIAFDVSDFYDWEGISGNLFSVKWEGMLYLPSERHVLEVRSTCQSALIVDGIVAQAPPSSLDIGTAEGRQGLGQGWSFDEAASDVSKTVTFAWSSATTSDIYLGVSEPADMILTFRAMAFDYPNSQNQQVKVAVNGVEITSILMKKGWRWDVYAVPVPKAVIQQGQRGIASVRLRYTDTARPAEVVHGSSDTRKIAVALDKIGLAPAQQLTAVVPRRSALSQGFHSIMLLAQSNGVAPTVHLGWTIGNDEKFSMIPEDDLFPKDDEEREYLQRTFRWERAFFAVIFFVKLAITVFIGGTFLVAIFPHANASGIAQFRKYLGQQMRMRWRAAILRGFRAVATLKAAEFFGRYDVWIIAALRPLLFLSYFWVEKFFLYAWDDQESYFEVAMGLVNFDLEVDRFTFGFPLLLSPFIKIFHPQNFNELVLPFSIFNAFILGTLGIYCIFHITNMLVKDRYAARIATLLYVIHPFFPLFARTKWNAIFLYPVYWADMVGWNMTSDQVGVVFLLLAVLVFLKSMQSRNGMILAGIALGYVGLIRMPNLIILIPLLYVALLERMPWKQFFILFMSMGVVLSPQLAYNWHFFGSPLKFGYTALGHIKQFWTPPLIPRQIATIVWDHAAFFIAFMTTFLIYAHRKIGGALTLWVLLFTLYYAGYEALYNDPVRFLLPIRPALCITVGILLASGKDIIERCFLFAGLFILQFVSSYRLKLSIPSDAIPAVFILLGVLFVMIGILLRVRSIVLACMSLYIACFLYLLKLPIPAWGIIAAAALLINLMQFRWWGQLAQYEGERP